MKKFYSLVLMATALLIGTNAWANYDPNWLQDQFDAIQADGQTHTIVMEDDINLDVPVYLGTATVDEARKSIILDMNGHHITMNATKWVSTKGNVFCSVFNITHGKLLIKNSKKSTTTSLIQFTGNAYGKYNDIFNVAGSYKSSRWVKNGSGVYEISESAAKNTRDANGGWFTHLIIDEGVKLYAPNTVFGAGISIDGYYTNFRGQVSATASVDSVFGKTSLKGSAGSLCLTGREDAPRYNTAIMSAASNGTGEGFGYGVRVEVYGDIEFASDATNESGGKSYGIKLNGGLRSTLKTRDYFHPDYCKNMDEAYVATYGATGVTQKNLVIDSVGTYRDHYFNHRDDTIDAPFLYIGKTAHIIASAELNEATAIYCSGYGKTLIEGACSGNSGVNIKSGTLEIHDAEITCTATSTSVYAAEGGNNATGTGAVVVNSVEGRAGGIEVIISGDSKVSTDYGYAIAETVNTITEGTKVSSITIDGGTIQGGASSDSYDGGAIVISEETKGGDVVVYGTNLTGNTNVQVGGDGDLDELTPNDVIVTEVIVDGKPTVVVSQGETPDEVDEAATDSEHSIMNATEASITWTGTVDQIIDGNKTLDYLEMNLTTGTTPKTPVPQQLTIESGYTLTVGRVVLGEAAVIIVKPGAKFIVTGTQGIVAPKVDNIILQASETDQAVFLFNPAVTSNRHPNATVQMYAKAHHATDGTWYSQHFGIPTFNTPAITWAPGTTYLYKFEESGWVNITALSQLEPFVGYSINNTSETAAGVYTFKGQLNGNTDAPLKFVKTNYNLVANSYAAPMAMSAVFDTLQTQYGNAVELSAWIYVSDEDRHVSITKAGVDSDEDPTAIKTIAPMQGFILNCGASIPTDGAINYGASVWNNPNKTGVAIMAPARNRKENSARVTIVVSTEKSKDAVVLRESDEYSSEFDNGADAHKYMSERVFDFYSENNGENFSDVATDNLEGTMLTLKAKNETAYTMSFRNVNNFNYVLRDNLSGAIIPVVEGTTYDFFMAEGTTANGRFEVIDAAKVPTAVENVDATRSVKGVYTILGQYVGESSILNTLPSGIYVVDGQRIVK